jgi:hypothetical protein
MSTPNMLWTDETLVPTQNDLMQQMVERGNLLRACHRVVSNGGSPGVDGMNTRELPGWLQGNLDELIESLQNGTYKPSPVRLVEIEKPGGGKRGLGVPKLLSYYMSSQFVLGMFSDIPIKYLYKYWAFNVKWINNSEINCQFDGIMYFVLHELSILSKS